MVTIKYSDRWTHHWHRKMDFAFCCRCPLDCRCWSANWWSNGDIIVSGILISKISSFSSFPTSQYSSRPSSPSQAKLSVSMGSSPSFGVKGVFTWLCSVQVVDMDEELFMEVEDGYSKEGGGSFAEYILDVWLLVTLNLFQCSWLKDSERAEVVKGSTFCRCGLQLKLISDIAEDEAAHVCCTLVKVLAPVMDSLTQFIFQNTNKLQFEHAFVLLNL